MPRLDEVFKLNGVPTYTFVRPTEFNRLYGALRAPGRGIVLEGPSGIGKTTAITKAVEALLGTAPAIAELSARRPKDVEYIEAIHELDHEGIVVVDDFHRLSLDQQERVSDYLKVLADTANDKTKLVIVGINNAGIRLVELAPDLHARVEVIRLESNSDEKVAELIRLGETSMNLSLADRMKIVENARGSFYLAQMLCYECCLQANILDSPEQEAEIDISVELVKTKLFEKLSARFQNATKTFARGMKFQRDGRAPYYQVLKWLAESGDWSIDVEQEVRKRPTSRGSVGQIIQKGFLAQFISNNSAAFNKLLHYENVTLTIEDPQYLFYLRETIWPELAVEAGFTNVEREHPYDFAFSFAGSNRQVARKMADSLREMQLEVFFDEYEQSRILAEDVEEYLRPIYQSQANFVVVLLSNDYPNRIWTKFESDQFKARFGDHKVIPVVYSDVVVDSFSLVKNTGFATLHLDKLEDEEVARIVSLLEGKLIHSTETQHQPALPGL